MWKKTFFLKNVDQNHRKSLILVISLSWFWPLIFLECKAFLLCNPVQQRNKNCNQLSLRRFCKFSVFPDIQIWGPACQSKKNRSTPLHSILHWKNAVNRISILVPVETIQNDQGQDWEYSHLVNVYCVMTGSNSPIGTLLDLSDVRSTKSSKISSNHIFFR